MNFQKFILFSTFCVFALSVQAQTTKHTFTSKNCDYTVYKTFGGGTIQCNDWNKVGTVSPGSSKSVTIKPGQNVIIRIMEGNNGPCVGNRMEREENISMPSNATKSHHTTRELHDWGCD